MLPGLICLVVAMVLLAVPAMAATTQVNVTKYCDNNYSAVEQSATVNYTYMMNNYPQIYSNGPVYMQGGSFNTNDVWGTAGQGMRPYGEHNGTYVHNLTDKVGGMSDGDELWVHGIDWPVTRYFNYTNVYTPNNSQGDMILSWWDSDYGFVSNGWSQGMRLFFYTPPESHGVNDSLNFTNMDMHDSMASWYWMIIEDKYNSGHYYPSAKGLSVKNVTDLKIYPPHRYDFNTTGNTPTKYAYYGEVAGVPNTATVPSNAFGSTTDIADNDSASYLQKADTTNYSAAQRFVFNVTENATLIETLGVTWIGNGSHDNESATQGATLYIWDGTSSSYEQLATTTQNGTRTLSDTLTSGISDYVVNGNVTVLVKQNDVTNTVGETTYYSRLATDYVKLVVRHHNKNSEYTL